MTKYVYSFGNGTADGDGKMKDTLGGKGAGLAEMSRAKLPVPPGFTISTEVCNIYFQNKNAVPAEIHEQMLEAGPEKDLYDEYQRIAGQPIESVISRLRPKVDLFFDKVLVNAPDARVRLNRLTLLQTLLAEFSTVADFSEIVTHS